jgi:hypothetical protein
MQRLSGQLGTVLVVMTGYDDPGYGFDEAVDALVSEAQRQRIDHVLWLSLRTAGVTYEDPQHQANARTYREANKVLFARAARLDGFLQVADWATHSAERDGWFEADGLHLKPTGVDGLTAFVAEQVGHVFAGESVTPPDPPWYPLRVGEWGDAVTEVQRALVAAGVDIKGGVDGTFGEATATAVLAFQRQRNLDMSGVVDQATAAALGIWKAPTRAAVEAPAAGAGADSAAAAATPTTVAPRSTAGGVSPNVPLLLLVGLNVVLAWYVGARIRRRRRQLSTAETDQSEPLERDAERSLV